METLPLLNKIAFNAVNANPRFKRKKTRQWLVNVAGLYGRDISELNYNFCSDAYLHEMNVKYLGHDYYTDIITFDLSDGLGHIEGDIYISIDRVKDNAAAQNIKTDTELLRVIVHGLLHLVGYKDGTKEQKEKMRSLENFALEMY